jgi:hypothetical protein
MTWIQNDIRSRVIQTSLISTYLSGLRVQPKLEKKNDFEMKWVEIVTKKKKYKKPKQVTLCKADGVEKRKYARRF